ncbi:MAG: hypothetical protein ABI652_06600, partial [Acidobacteriota bacterium]
MSNVVSRDPNVEPARATSARNAAGSSRANALAERLEQGANALASFASSLTETEWHARIPHD